MVKNKQRGHYCKICGERKANEKFSGRGHATHICKKCSTSPQERKNELPNIEITDDVIFDDADIDCLPILSEKKKFTELDLYEKMWLSDYLLVIHR